MTFVPTFDASADVLRGVIQRSPGELPLADADLANRVIGRMMASVHTLQGQVEYCAKGYTKKLQGSHDQIKVVPADQQVA